MELSKTPTDKPVGVRFHIESRQIRQKTFPWGKVDFSSAGPGGKKDG